MERRMFLIHGGSVLLVVPIAWTVGCGSDSGSSDLRFTSSNVEGHTHDFTITMTELTSPPSGGLSRGTTSSEGHTHTAELSQAELGQIQGGQAVSKDTSTVLGHKHTFAFSRATAVTAKSSGY